MSTPAHTRVFGLVGSPEGVRAALRHIRVFLRDAGLNEDRCGTAEIVLAEALNNVTEHALAVRDAQGRIGCRPDEIRVTITANPDMTAITIVDGGAPMPGGTLPPGQPPTLEAASDLPEGGFGWVLIRHLTTQLGYVRRAGRNHLYLRMDHQAQIDADAL